jgi:hypothetical protein
MSRAGVTGWPQTPCVPLHCTPSTQQSSHSLPPWSSIPRRTQTHRLLAHPTGSSSSKQTRPHVPARFLNQRPARYLQLPRFTPELSPPNASTSGIHLRLREPTTSTGRSREHAADTIPSSLSLTSPPECLGEAKPQGACSGKRRENRKTPHHRFDESTCLLLLRMHDVPISGSC